MVNTIEWTPEGVVMIDQTKLPSEETFLVCRDYVQVAEAIRGMVIRGAPAIGCAAAMGVAIGVLNADDSDLDASFEEICATLAATRPTAVNLFWAIDRMRGVYEGLRARGADVSEIRQALVDEARRVLDEDIESNRALGRYGADLLPAGGTVMTHCNAGALATGGYGTALGVIRAAVEAGNSLDVLANETRPFMQGSRLTVWELQQDGIPVTLLTDNMAGHLMQRGRVQAIVVGADRIAANGDVANKIGTYPLAVLAKENGIPFYVAAPTTTVDLQLESGAEIPIEERSADEVTQIRGHQIAPVATQVCNPAFDVTPNRYVTAIITEQGVARAPYVAALKALCEAHPVAVEA
ncbi:MAG: S-methyl-5-thioribose-1-phosphate isomerase [Bryobacterales bacterium]|nr:S-methyl-5-thioribose-1-phosphate isomerase [Bryobacterales bacterium]MDE0622715.1 S-methyl-5-thioribose-1-phosphate isomerase [Bryobacterales bacterium]